MNKLQNLSDFQTILSNYKISDGVVSVLRSSKLLLLAGVTSSGRNTVIGELLKTNNFHYIVSDTTRKPRVNHGVLEQDGNEYWFKTEEELLAGLRSGEYIEAAIVHNQQVSGISFRELVKSQSEGKIAVTDIEIMGVRSIVRVKPDTKCVFMIPPSFEEWMKRLANRGKMSESELSRRLKSAIKEINFALEVDLFEVVVNNEFHDTTKTIANIFNQSYNNNFGRQVAKELVTEVENFLGTV